ncbi:heavy-metal-associated domain-containing protein [Halarcobacter sp.]|uniref:heavy-metal-associated domain-containing protein n=1 Tax=Halarcobacter TaxID=2321115 RepID=UPI003A8D36AA
MKKTFKANNIACGSCSNLIKGSLEEEFGEIIINLNTEPKEVTVEIEDKEKETKFKQQMKELGFEIIEE